MPRRLLHAGDRRHPHRPARPGPAGGITRVVEGAAPHARARAAVDQPHRAGKHRGSQRDRQGHAVGKFDLEQVGIGQGLARCRPHRTVAHRIGGPANARHEVVGGNLAQMRMRQPLLVEHRYGPIAKARLGGRELTPSHPAHGHALIDVGKGDIERAVVTRRIARAHEPGA
jgi:hypothetical protein